MPKSKSIYFFATKSDIAAVILDVESQQSLKYTEAGMFDSPEPRTLVSGLEIPNLGHARSGEPNLEPFWLITRADSRIKVESVPQRRGGTRFSVDAELNPESVVLQPGGVFEGIARWPGRSYEGRAVVAGQIGTATPNEVSLELAKQFAVAIRKRFIRIKSSYVGSEAERLFGAGWRLTPGIRSAEICDLTR